MLRILFSILSVVATAITLTVQIPFSEWWKYIPMAGLIIIALILWISEIPGNRRKKPDFELPNSQKEESLQDLGILEIRPKTTGTSEEELEDPSSSQKPMKQHLVEPPTFQTSLLTEPAQSDSDSAFDPIKHRDPLDKNILIPVLHGFRTALDAHAVGIIRSDSGNYEYMILGSVGQDWIRSRGESFVLKYDLLENSETTVIHSVGSDGLQSNHLTYSRKPASITGVGITMIGETGNLLLIDTTDEAGFSHPRAKELLEIFGQPFSLLLYKADPNRPRYEIISEEMKMAKIEQKKLALALVLPQREEKLRKTYEDFIGKIEEELSNCLTHADPESRVIKFGELLYGVFIDSNNKSLEKWCEDVRKEVLDHGGLLTGGVFIGIAPMTDKHQSPDALREDALSALIEAYNGPRDTVIIQFSR